MLQTQSNNAVHFNWHGHKSVKIKILTTYGCHQWNKGTLTFIVLPGMQGVHLLLSGNSTLHGKGPQNDQQQAQTKFGVHNYLFCNRKTAVRGKTNVKRSCSFFFNDLTQSLFGTLGFFQRPLFNSEYWSTVWCPTLAWKLELATVDRCAISNTLFKYWRRLQETLSFISHRPRIIYAFLRGGRLLEYEKRTREKHSYMLIWLHWLQNY